MLHFPLRPSLVFLSALLFVGGSFSAASAASKNAEEELAPGFNACMDKADNTAAMSECYTNANDYWDKKLNENFKKAKKACADLYDDQQCVKKLVSAEKKWIAYRDAMADVVYSLAGGGTMSGLVANEFFCTETKKQAKLLVVPE